MPVKPVLTKIAKWIGMALPGLHIPHDSIDVSATGSTDIVHPKILELMGE